MDALAVTFLAFPPPHLPTDAEYDKLIKTHLKQVSSVDASKLRLGGKSDSLFDVLDPAVNSISYLFVLLANIESPKSFSPGSSLWQKAVLFLQSFDAIQIRYVGGEWRQLMEFMARSAEQSSNVGAVIDAMRASLLRVDPLSSTLTSVHVQFLRLCLLARAFDAALSVIEGDVFHFPSAEKPAALPLPCAQHPTSSTYITQSSGFSKKLEYHDPLLYHLYGGMVYLGVRSWERAVRFFELAITHPTPQAPSMIQVEAYKKWILASLLGGGVVPGMPRGTGPHASKHFKSLGKPYEILAEAFKKADPAKLEAEVQSGHTIWQTDCNLGLTHQLLTAHRRFAVLALARTYTAVPVRIVTRLPFAKGILSADVQTYLGNLIDSGQIDAELVPASNPLDSVLRFRRSGDDDEVQADAAMEGELIAARQRCQTLDSHMQVEQRRMEMSKEYIDAERKVRKSRAEGGADMMNGIDGPFPSQPAFEMVDEEVLEEL